MNNIEEAMQKLTRGIDSILSAEALHKKLSENRPLRIKFGVDPTAPDIHLGHTVPLFKMREFQDLGHTAVLLIGDFTARIGDPTGRKSTRPQLTEEDIRHNAQTYEEQAFKILDREKTEIVWNSHWFEPLTSSDMIKLLSRRSVAQMLQRRDFKERFHGGVDIALHELVYPVLQGWDSVMIKADVELGGSEQLFNMLVGRDFQEQENMPQQVVMTLPLLEGTDGHEKMSKSLGNTIGVTDPPKEMFGKTMSISDDLMAKWGRILFGEETDPALHPMESKKRLAQKITTQFHSAEAAMHAREEWERQFSQRQTPEEMPTFEISAPQQIWELLKNAGLAPSSSEARRMIKQGAVSVNESKCTDDKHMVDSSCVIKYGKRHYLRVEKKS